MNAAGLPRLEVTGLDAMSLAAQSLCNVWQSDKHDPCTRLAHVAFHCQLIDCDVLERITWALLAWPNPAHILLVDRRFDSVVGEIACSRPPIRAWPRRWRTGQRCWLMPRASRRLLIWVNV